MEAEPGLIAGWHAVQAAMRRPSGGVREIWLSRGREDRRGADLVKQANERDIPLRIKDASLLDQRAPGINHQGVLAWVEDAGPLDEAALIELLDGLGRPPFLLALDGVQDPHNLGACLRTANAAGVDAVIAPRDRAVGLTPAVRKTAAGGSESLPFVQVTNLARCLRELKQRGVWVIGAAGEADEEIYRADLTGPLALVMGAEDKGLRRLTRETCDLLVRIPMRGTVESLNVSVAAAICLYEAVRQRQPA